MSRTLRKAAITSDNILIQLWLKAAAKFDFGICSKVAEDEKIVQVPIIRQPLVIIQPKGWKRATEPSDIMEVPFVSYLPEYPMYAQVTALLEKLEQKPCISYYAYSEDAIARLVEQGLGISIIAQTDSLGMYDMEVFKPDWRKKERYIYLTYLKNGYRGRAVEEMILA